MFDLSTLAQTCAIPWCPAPPSWSVDWTAIIRQYVWLRSLTDVPQDPDYHAEGDVLTHTHMVVEVLAGMDAWQGLDENVRSLLFAAALLHDIAKPASTRTEVDGRITSPGHARRGAQMTRALLWAGDTFAEPPPFPWRETVARLVRFHGLPLWFWEKTDPRRAVIEASQSVRLDWVALLAEADARGRVCADRAELIERVDLFRAYCVEQRCYDRPRAFGSPHGRFRYFRRPHADPDYVGYDDTTFEVVLMSGLPGAGKDRWIHEHYRTWPVVSLDDIRHDLKVAPADAQGVVVQAAKARARELLRQKQSFVWNATNVTRTLRSLLVDLFADYGAYVRIIYIDASLDEVLRRNRERRAGVPEQIVRKLLGKLDVPDLTEAHAVQWVYDGGTTA